MGYRFDGLSGFAPGSQAPGYDECFESLFLK